MFHVFYFLYYKCSPTQQQFSSNLNIQHLKWLLVCWLTLWSLTYSRFSENCQNQIEILLDTFCLNYWTHLLFSLVFCYLGWFLFLTTLSLVGITKVISQWLEINTGLCLTTWSAYDIVSLCAFIFVIVRFYLCFCCFFITFLSVLSVQKQTNLVFLFKTNNSNVSIQVIYCHGIWSKLVGWFHNWAQTASKLVKKKHFISRWS